MSKLMKFFGLFPAFLLLAGGIFKFMHWPAASIIILVAMALLVLIYCPMWLVKKLKITIGGLQKITIVMTFLFMVVLGLAFLFKAMHWPFAGILVYLMLALFIILIPFLIITAGKEIDSDRHFMLNHVLVLFIAGGVIAMWPTFMGPSKKYNDMLKYQSKVMERSIHHMQHINEMVYDKTIARLHNDSSGIKNQVENLHSQTLKQVNLLSKIKGELIALSLGISSQSPDTLCSCLVDDISNMDVIKKYFFVDTIKYADGNSLYKNLQEYNALVQTVAANLKIKEFHNCLDKKLQGDNWLQAKFMDIPFGHGIAQLLALQEDILYVEINLLESIK